MSVANKKPNSISTLVILSLFGLVPPWAFVLFCFVFVVEFRKSPKGEKDWVESVSTQEN